MNASDTGLEAECIPWGLEVHCSFHSELGRGTSPSSVPFYVSAEIRDAVLLSAHFSAD